MPAEEQRRLVPRRHGDGQLRGVHRAQAVIEVAVRLGRPGGGCRGALRGRDGKARAHGDVEEPVVDGGEDAARGVDDGALADAKLGRDVQHRGGARHAVHGDVQLLPHAHRHAALVLADGEDLVVADGVVQEAHELTREAKVAAVGVRRILRHDALKPVVRLGDRRVALVRLLGGDRRLRQQRAQRRVLLRQVGCRQRQWPHNSGHLRLHGRPTPRSHNYIMSPQHTFQIASPNSVSLASWAGAAGRAKESQRFRDPPQGVG